MVEQLLNSTAIETETSEKMNIVFVGHVDHAPIHVHATQARDVTRP